MSYLAMERILFAASLLVPAIAVFIRPWLGRMSRGPWLYLACTLIVYSLILARVHVIDLRFSAELTAFDLDRDGSFSGEELSPAQTDAMETFSTDTARVFAPCTAAILAAAYVAVCFGVARVVAWVRNLILNR
jgi:hypothetical protein